MNQKIRFISKRYNYCTKQYICAQLTKRMNKRNLIASIITITVIGLSVAKAQQPVAKEVNWQPMDTVAVWHAKHPKPLLIFMTEPGNDSVTKMLNTTFKNPGIIQYINNRFYAVQFDITSDKPVTFLNQQVYRKKPGEKYNDLSNSLFGDHPAAPAYILYSMSGKGQAFYGIKDAYEFRALLAYIFEEVNRTVSFDDWYIGYQDAYPPDNSQKKLNLRVKWTTLDNALSANDNDGKKIFLYWYTKWSNSSNVMLMNTLENDSIVTYLNENFHCVMIDAQTTDTLFWKGQKYYNDGRDYKFHQMAISMLKGKMAFPSLVFFGADDKMVALEQIYLPPDKFRLLLRYINEEAYLSMSLKDFLVKNNNGYIEIPLNLEFRQKE